MSKLLNLNEIENEKILDEIFSNELIIFEDVQGSKIFVNWDGKSFTIKAKSLSSDPINLVDLAMQNYYNIAIDYFNSLDKRVKSLLNKKWWFCLEYFPDTQPGNITYSRLPKNNLVLASICKNGKFDYTVDELDEYSRLLGVDVIPVIFKGKLGEESIQAIKYFLNTSESDLEYVFGERSFSYFFYKLLNPQLENSFLMEEEFQNNLQKLIIRVKNQDVSFEILNPLYKRISDLNSTDFVEIYSLILVNFLNFCQSVDIDDIKLKGDRRDEAYLYIINKLFNMYISQVQNDILNFEFTVPEFFDKDKFRVNIELIGNKMTREFISQDKKFEYMYKIILGSFNKPRKKPIGVFTDATVILFNEFVKSIQNRIDVHFKKKSEVELTRSGLIDFGKFFDLKYDVDADQKVYPDVYQEIEKTRDEKKKGKSEIIGKGKEEKQPIPMITKEEELGK